MLSVVCSIDESGYSEKGHAAGVFPSGVLQRIEALLPLAVERSCETGCGKSTILLSNLSADHTVFSLDDTEQDGSSVAYYRDCPLTRMDCITEVFGPTQDTLAGYRHKGPYDIVLIDGPHGYPFPELEYFHLYPHLREGGILIIDDIDIPTIGKMAEFLREDDMFELIARVNYTVLFKRTAAPMFDPKGDGWWTQKYNRRRVSKNHEAHLPDGGAITIPCTHS